MMKLMRILLLIIGTLIILGALLSSAGVGVYRFPASWVSLPLAAGAACLIIGSTIRGKYQKAGLWFSLALLGQAAILGLTLAGPSIGYQHLKLPAQILNGISVWPVLVIFLQTIAVSIGIKNKWIEICTWIEKNFRWWQLAILLLILLFTSASLSRQLGTYLYEIVIAVYLQILSLATVVLTIWAISWNDRIAISNSIDKRLRSMQEDEISERKQVDWFLIAVAGWVTIVTLGFSAFIYQRHPHVQDEVMYLWQARYMAEGRLYVQAPPVPEAFSFYMVPEKSERWYSIFPPGWPAMLAVGVKLGAPWIINPLLAGINILLAYWFIRDLYDRRIARMSILLLGISPWFLFMGMNFMAHTFTLTCALVAVLAIQRVRHGGKIWWAALSGLSIGVASLIRPLDGVLLAVTLGAWAMFFKPRLRLGSLLAFIIAGIAVGALTLPYNQAITGDPLTFPLSKYYIDYYGAQSNAFGFGPGRGLGWGIDAFPGHSPLEAVLNAFLNAYLINVELFGWSCGSLLLIGVLIVSGHIKRNDALMLGFILATIGIFSLYWFNGGPDFGARYWYLIIVPLVVLTVRGINVLDEKMSTGKDSPTQSYYPVTMAVLLFMVVALVNFISWRAADKYYHYLGMSPNVDQLVKANQIGESLILVQGELFPDYQSAWIFNPLDPFAEQPVFAWDGSPEMRARVLEAYLGRPVWLFAGPSVTHNGYTVIAGPLSTRDLLDQNRSVP
jgi:4-amino-4-deoxy-L-arabinose transferase-like glycosyltransferase